jgi:hypothetical protein
VASQFPPPESDTPARDRETVPVPAEQCAARAREVSEYCAGLSFGAALAKALFEKGDVLL